MGKDVAARMPKPIKPKAPQLIGPTWTARTTVSDRMSLPRILLTEHGRCHLWLDSAAVKHAHDEVRVVDEASEDANARYDMSDKDEVQSRAIRSVR